MEIAKRNEIFVKKTEFGAKMMNEFIKSNINFNETL
jgi:hypothetical protein